VICWTRSATEPWRGDQAAPALAAFLLPEAAGPCGSTANAVGAINAATQADGLTLLHRAVRCGSAAMLESLLSFGCAQGFCWRVRRAAAHARPPPGMSGLGCGQQLVTAHWLCAVLSAGLQEAIVGCADKLK